MDFLNLFLNFDEFLFIRKTPDLLDFHMKSIARFLCLTLAVTTLFATNLKAEQFTFSSLDDAKVSITFPDDWSVTAERFQLRAFPQDDSIYFGFLAVPKGTTEDKIGLLVSSAIDEMVSDFQQVKVADSLIDVNGLKLNVSNAVGKDRDTGDKLNVSLGYFTPDNDPNHLMAIIYFGTEEAEKRHSKQIQNVIQSIKSLKKPIPSL